MSAVLRRKVIPLVAAPAGSPTKGPVRRVNLQKTPELAEKLRALREAKEEEGTVARYRAKVCNYRTAIRAKCVECCCGSLKEVTECRITSCALHPFRMGENPFNKKTRERMAREAGEEFHDDDDTDDESDN